MHRREDTVKKFTKNTNCNLEDTVPERKQSRNLLEMSKCVGNPADEGGGVGVGVGVGGVPLWGISHELAPLSIQSTDL